jgi:hypothetical protein
VHNLRIGLDILQGAQITQLYLARGWTNGFDFWISVKSVWSVLVGF